MFLKQLTKLANLSSLRYFYEVARAGSIRRAANAMFIVPSAVSRQIRLLEEELGVSLFERHPGGVTLTHSGNLLLFHASRAMQELANAQESIAASTNGHHGTVLIGVNETIGREFMTRFLPNFHTEHPNVRPHVTVDNTSTLVESLLQGQVDIVLGYGVPDRPELHSLSSYSLTLCAMLHKA